MPTKLYSHQHEDVAKAEVRFETVKVICLPMELEPERHLSDSALQEILFLKSINCGSK
jgi:hypothetical protein